MLHFFLCQLGNFYLSNVTNRGKLTEAAAAGAAAVEGVELETQRSVVGAEAVVVLVLPLLLHVGVLEK